jgi:hypothetical protein
VLWVGDVAAFVGDDAHVALAEAGKLFAHLLEESDVMLEREVDAGCANGHAAPADGNDDARIKHGLRIAARASGLGDHRPPFAKDVGQQGVQCRRGVLFGQTGRRTPFSRDNATSSFGACHPFR